MYRLSPWKCNDVITRAAVALLEYCMENGIHYLITGVSGGLDSAVCGGINQVACVLAKDRGYDLFSVGILMPCFSAPESETRGREAIEKFGAIEMNLCLDEAFMALENTILGTDSRIAEIQAQTGASNGFDQESWDKKVLEDKNIAQGNIKARLRMMLGTYHVARMLGGIVISTDNLSEWWMGFWTLHGDVGDFGPVQQVMKGLELYDIARELGVPQSIIYARPDDGLGIGNGDEDQLGANYPTLDYVMIQLIQQGFDIHGSKNQLDSLPAIKDVSEETVRRLAERCLGTAFKRAGNAPCITRADLGLPEIRDIVL